MLCRRRRRRRRTIINAINMTNTINARIPPTIPPMSAASVEGETADSDTVAASDIVVVVENRLPNDCNNVSDPD